MECLLYVRIDQLAHSYLTYVHQFSARTGILLFTCFLPSYYIIKIITSAGGCCNGSDDDDDDDDDGDDDV